MAAQSPFRRWKRFFSAFDTIDTAIVASQREEEMGCAEELRDAMGQVVQLLCDVPVDNPAEYLCEILDELMVEYLITLETVPVTPSELASTDLAKAVGALKEHECQKIRDLAGEVLGMWRATVERDLAKARATVEELRKISDDDVPAIKKEPVAAADGEEKEQAKDASKTGMGRSGNDVEMAKSGVPAKVSPQLPKKNSPIVCALRANVISTDKMTTPKKMPANAGSGGRDHAGADKMAATKRKLGEGYQQEDAKRQRKNPGIEAPRIIYQQQQQQQHQMDMFGRSSMATVDKMPAMDKMEATKRKLSACYQAAEDAKRQRRISVIEAPKPAKMVEQRQRKTHPIFRERSQARHGTSAAVRRSLTSSFSRV